MKTKSILFLLLATLIMSACAPSVPATEETPLLTVTEAPPPIETHTESPLQSEQPASTAWKAVRDEGYGFGLAVPCWWSVSPIPEQGFGGVMTIKNYDPQMRLRSNFVHAMYAGSRQYVREIGECFTTPGVDSKLGVHVSACRTAIQDRDRHATVRRATHETVPGEHGERRADHEQQLRAICGLPLARPHLLAPAVMLNLLGDLWVHGEPRWDRVLGIPGVRLHLYGKTPRPGRKMGHLLILGPADPLRTASELRRLLTAHEAA